MIKLEDKLFSYKGLATGRIYFCEVVKLIEKKGITFALVRLLCNQDLQLVRYNDLKEELYDSRF